MKKLLIGLLAGAMILTFWLAIPEGQAKEAIVLKMASFLPKNDPNMIAWWPLIDEINKRAKGELIIKYVGIVQKLRHSCSSTEVIWMLK